VAQTPQEEPFSESHLGSAEYRERLMRKLNCLIAVLEVATARVRKNLTGSPHDDGKLTRICANLQSTLEVCQRARSALRRRQDSAAAAPERPLALPPARPGTQGEQAPSSKPERKKPGPRKGHPGRTPEITTEAERQKFAKLPPIDRRTILRCDLDDLGRRLCS